MLMASAGVAKEDEKRSAGHRLVLGCIRCGVPPHRDNENAVGHLAQSTRDSAKVRRGPHGQMTFLEEEILGP